MNILSAFLITILLISCSSASNESNDKLITNETQPSNLDNATIVKENVGNPMESIKMDGEKKITDKPIGTTDAAEKQVIDQKEIEPKSDVEVDMPSSTIIPKIDFSGVYPQILSSFVSSSGKVNYAQIKVNTEMLGQAINHFQEHTPKVGWSNNQKLAYWINAYNLFTIKLIIDNYPVKSIKEIANGKPWDKKFILLDGKILSLNDIENNIIRKEFNEPRIHFAVNCASISCPKLLNQEYTAANLNSLLDKQAKRYINDKNENTFTANSAKISNIFDWYKVDFESGVIPFLNKYLDTPLPSDAKITYQDYNWNLNN